MRFRDRPDPSSGYYTTACGKHLRYPVGVEHEKNCPRCQAIINEEDRDDEPDAQEQQQ